MMDKYEQGRMLGRGGMGEVYEGVHRVTGRRVAIKRIAPELASHPEVVGRFLREARAATALNHPNVVQILDCGLDEGAPYLVMELLEGSSLATLLEDEGKMTPVRIYTLVRPLLGALERAHALGMVHRDLKPENIFLSEVEGLPLTPKLLDFGIARYREADDAERGLQRTQTGMVLGTPAFMSPEQARGLRDVDGRTDIYALGVILYRALTGRLPHEETNYNALIVAIVSEAPPDLRSLEPSVPEPVANAVARALEKQLDQRFESMRELRDALDAALPEVAAPRAERTPLPIETAATQLAMPTPAQRGRAPTTQFAAARWVLFGLGALGLGALVAASLDGGAPTPRSDAAASSSSSPDAAIRAHTKAPPAPAEEPTEAPLLEVPPPSVALPHEPAAPVERPRSSARVGPLVPPEGATPLASPATPARERPAPPEAAHRAGELDPDDFFP